MIILNAGLGNVLQRAFHFINVQCSTESLLDLMTEYIFSAYLFLPFLGE